MDSDKNFECNLKPVLRLQVTLVQSHWNRSVNDFGFNVLSATFRSNFAKDVHAKMVCNSEAPLPPCVQECHCVLQYLNGITTGGGHVGIARSEQILFDHYFSYNCKLKSDRSCSLASNVIVFISPSPSTGGIKSVPTPHNHEKAKTAPVLVAHDGLIIKSVVID